MGLGKIGMSLAQKTYAWVKASDKTSILQTKSAGKINFIGSKFTFGTNNDVVQISRQIKSPGTVLNVKTGKVEHIEIEDSWINKCDGLEAFNKEGNVIGRVSYKEPDTAGLLYPIDKPSIYLDYIGTDGDYKGIGTELVRKLVQKSKELGYEGRVRLIPCTGSIPRDFRFPGFYEKCTKSSAAIQYKKMGFKAYDKEIDKQLEQELASGGKGFIYKNGKIARDKFTTPMYLPEESIQKYL